MKWLKRILYLAGGVCWLLFAAGFVLLVVGFFAGGAGLPFLNAGNFVFSISAGSVLLGLVWLTGLGVATAVCVVVSFWLFFRSFTGEHSR